MSELTPRVKAIALLSELYQWGYYAAESLYDEERMTSDLAEALEDAEELLPRVRAFLVEHGGFKPEDDV